MKRKVLIATHGKLASGMKDAAVFISGCTDIKVLCCFCEDINDPLEIQTEIKKLIKNDSDEIIVFTDLLGGSVNRTITELLGSYNNLHIVTGINLAIILEFICSNEDTVTAIHKAIEAGKNDIHYMNEIIE